MDKLAFRPVQGLEENILKTEPLPGYVYFALDTKKIYCGDSEKGFIPMGGNSGIYYGLKPKEENVDSDQSLFYFKVDEIEGNQLPNKDDLILNIPDGSFYRVLDIELDEIKNEISIKTERLTIAGSGSGGGIASTIIRIQDKDKNNIKYFSIDEDNIYLNFSVSSSAEENTISTLTYQYGGKILEQSFDQPFGDFSFNLKRYIHLLSTSSANTIQIIVEDEYGTRKSFSYTIYLIYMKLETKESSPIILFDSDTSYYKCVPYGSKALKNFSIYFDFYDVNGITKITSYNTKITSQYIGQINNILLNFSSESSPFSLTEGAYKLKIYLSGEYQTQDGNLISKTSNIIEHSIIRYIENDIFQVYFNVKPLEQYTTVSIPCMLATENDSGEISFITENVDTNKTVAKKYNLMSKTLSYVDFYCEELGTYNFTFLYGTQQFKYYNIRVTEYAGEIPSIVSDFMINLSAAGRSNDQSDYNQWESNGASVDFQNFYWGDINGWKKDDNQNSYLHLSSGAAIQLNNFEPFANDILSGNGISIELDFRFSGVLNYKEPLISCLSFDNQNNIICGFQLTGSESTFNTGLIKATNSSISEDETDIIFNTAVQGLTAKYIEDQRIHLTWVIEGKKSGGNLQKITTYINGIASGFTKYDNEDYIQQSNAAIFKVNSTYGDIDLYNIRFYNRALESMEVLNNYTATLDTNDQKVESYNWNNIMENGEISISQIQKEGYNLKIPFIKLTGGTEISKRWEILNTKDSNGNIIKRLPRAKKDFRLMSFEYFDPNNPDKNNDFTEIIKVIKDEQEIPPDSDLNDYEGVLVESGCKVYGQGTSSMEYPVKNLRIEFKSKELQLYNKAYPVKTFCFKADYMESSSSHNTGTANLVDDLLKNLNLQTPGQKFYKELDSFNYDIVTAIKGFPVAMFYSPDGEKYEYIGKYNFNLDKSTQEPFGFMPYPENSSDIENTEKILGWDTSGEKPEDIIRCFEFLNNASDIANFKNSETIIFKDGKYLYNTITTSSGNTGPDSLDAEDIDYAVEKGYSIYDPETGKESPFHCFFKKKIFNENNQVIDIVNNKNKKVYNWQNSLEARYPDPDAKSDGYIDRKYAIQFFEAYNWVNQTKNDLISFKNDFELYFNKDFVCFYYVITHVLLMIDSRAKNMMMASWGPENGNGHHIWYPIFYDMDTMLGLNNYGYNKFDYNSLDTQTNLYNGQDSIFWNTFKIAFADDIKSMYDSLRTTSGGLTYNKLLETYNKKQSNSWNEILYNEDSKYKYLRPFEEGFYDTVDESKDPVFVEPGQRNYLYAGQGRRSMHREYWLSNRLSFLDGYYQSSNIQGDRFTLRIYTPEITEKIYIKIFINSETEFNENLGKIYYYNTETSSYILIPSGAAFNDWKNYDLYKEATSEQIKLLNDSINAVPPNNDFNLTSSKNSYLSVNYGGITSSPVEAPINQSVKISAPKGAKYNDTETYIYEGSILSSLGDLSNQYLGRFDFPIETSKIKELILGNPNNKYYNPNFSALTIGSSAPYLELINIMNCSGLSKRSLDLSDCSRLKTVLATGSGLTNISFSNYGILEQLRLPNTINQLILTNQPELKTEQFTIGTCNYENNKYEYSNDYSSLMRVNIQNVPQLDTYNLIYKAQNLGYFYLPDINWTIKNSEEIGKTDEILSSINILDKLSGLQSAVSGINKQNALKGTILIDISDIKVNADNIYNKYGAIFPNVKIEYGSSISSESVLNNIITFKDTSGNIIWQKEISKSKNTFPSEFFDSSFSYGSLPTPSQSSNLIYNYTFSGWQIEGTENIYSKDNLYNIEITSDLTFIPIFTQTVNKYSIIYYDYDKKTKLETLEFLATDSLVPSSTFYPYKPDSSLELEQCYIFKNYKDLNNDQNLDTNQMNWPTTRNYQVYPVFEIGSVYDNILNEKYYNISNGNLSLKNKNEYVLRGKITLPLDNSLKSFYSISGQNLITHIFWEKNTVNLDTFQIKNCYSGTNLQYFQPIESTNMNFKVELGLQCFQSLQYLFKSMNDASINNFFKNVVDIEASCFAGTAGLQNKNIIIPKLEILKSSSFINTNLSSVTIPYIESVANNKTNYFDANTTVSFLSSE